MANGKITGWRPDKGFGFIRPDEGGEDVFFHVRDLQGARADQIAPGQRVSYRLEQGPKGPQAKAVRLLAEPSSSGAGAAGYRFLNPYNFVRYLETSRKTESLLARVAPPPHDRYVGLTGRITCTLTAETPIFVSDSHAVQGKATEHRTFRFFEYDGEPAIPATSLRGMVRSVFEAVTNSCYSVFQFDEPYALEHREARAPEMIPARVVELNDRGGKLELLDCTRDAPVDCSGRPTVTRAAAVARAYPPRVLDQRTDPPKPYRRDQSQLPPDSQDGMAVAALVTREPQLHRSSRFRSFIAQKVVPAAQAHTLKEGDGLVKVSGWLHMTGPNIENKHDERLFFRWPGSKPVHVSFNTDVVPEYNHHLEEYWKRNERKVKELGSKPWPHDDKALPHPSTFIEKDRKLKQGDLVYALLDKVGHVTALRPVSMPRLRYRTKRQQLLPASLHRCEKSDELCPACRVFGWVHGEAERIGKTERAAYAGRVQFTHGKPIPETLKPMAEITLAILASPKPTTTRFYLIPLSGRPVDGLDEEQAGYDGPNRLRGRKFYRHQGKADKEEYTRAGGKRDDQNRTIRGALDKGSAFTFNVEFENLEEVELGALLWSLEIEGMKHRLGFAKPLGLGSVSVRVIELKVLTPRVRYAALNGEGFTDCLSHREHWIQRFKDVMKNLYGQAFDQLVNVRDLRTLLSAPPANLPIHYPRSTEKPDPEGKNFEWFIGNKRGLKLALPLAPDDRAGLPLVSREGVPKK